MKDIANLHDVP